jgi:hypothetical protein
MVGVLFYAGSLDGCYPVSVLLPVWSRWRVGLTGAALFVGGAVEVARLRL